MGILKYFYFFILLIFPIAEIGKLSINGISFSINDVLVLAFSLLCLKFAGKDYKNSYLFKPIVLFTVVCFLSLAVNILNFGIPKILISSLYIFRWISYSFLYLWLVKQNKNLILKVRNFLIFPITIILLFGALQFVFYQNLRNLYYLGWDEHLYRLFSSFLDPNFAAAFLTISFIFLIYMSSYFLNSRKFLFFSFIIFLSLVNFIEIFLTYSRSGLIMLAVSLLTYLVISNNKKIILIAIVLLVISVIISPRSFSTEGTNIFRIASSEARLQSASIAVSIIQKNPLLGVGFNSYRYAQNKYGFLNGLNWETTHSGAGTDNSFLYVLATTGVIGFAAYIYLIYKILNLGRIYMKNKKISLLLISIMLGVLVDSLFVNSLFYVYIMEFVWIFAAITERS